MTSTTFKLFLLGATIACCILFACSKREQFNEQINSSQLDTTLGDLRLSISISPKQARILAAEQLPAVLQWIEPEDIALYGFSSTSEFSNISVGRPFYVTAMDVVKQMKSEGKTSLQINSMMLPLISGGTVRCFIFLSEEEGQWKAVGIGSKEDAVKGGSLFNKSDDTASLVIAIPQISEEFIADHSTGVSRYKPIFNSNPNLNQRLSNEGYSMNELMNLYTEALKDVDVE